MRRVGPDEAPAEDCPAKLTMKERAKKARHDAYVAARERRKADARTAELKARMKAARREASARARELRRTDPKQIARKEKLKQDRRAVNEQRRTAARTAERPQTGGDARSNIATVNRGVMLELIQGNGAETGTRSLASGRAALTVIEGGKSPKTLA